MLFAGSVASSSYSGFATITFLGSFVALMLPILIYWLGVWIWGEGYLFGLIKKPFKFLSKFKGQAEALDALSPKNNPWRRFWARYVDYIFWGLIFGFSMGLGSRISKTVDAFTPDNEALFGMLIIISWCVVEPILLSLFGSTPGKWLLKIQLRGVDGKKLSFGSALRRSWGVLLKGMALGFPIISFATLYSSYTNLKNTGSTKWDDEADTHITINKLSSARGWLILILVGAILGQVTDYNMAQKNVARGIEIGKTYQQKRTQILQSYLNYIDKAVQDTLNPKHFEEQLQSRADFSKNFSNIDNFVTATETNVSDTYSGFEREWHALSIPQSYDQTVLGSYFQQKESSLKLIHSMFANEHAKVETLKKLTLLLIIEQGRYAIQNDQFIFDNHDTLQEYNKYIAELNGEIQKGNGLLKELQK